MTRWLLIAGDFTPFGGMDRANLALAEGLASREEAEVHLVAHRVCSELEGRSSVRVHRVTRPLGSHMLGSPMLADTGERWAKRLAGAHVIANGGNADAGDVSWIHYLHAAYRPSAAGGGRGLAGAVARRYYLARERASLQRARLVLCNSERTRRDVRDRLGIEPSRIRVVYYGSDPEHFQPVTPDARASARRDLGWDPGRPVALFVGALGDRRKGFDRLFEAWTRLCRTASWDTDLAVAGHGKELVHWRRRAAEEGLDRRVRFLGFRDDISRLLAASDVLVHPARYEAYGLGVHEAICSGIPAIVSADAGVAERYPRELADLLIADVEDAGEIADRLQRWRADAAGAAARLRPLSDLLRSRTWRDMSAEIAGAVQA